MSTITKAMLFAEAAHEGQLRDFTGEAYIVHPRRVAAKAALFGLSDEAIAAAWLHDVVEDCGVKLQELHSMFGEKTANLVNLLTDPPDDPGNRAERHARKVQRLVVAGDAEAQGLKLLDMLDNATSIAGYNRSFWRNMKGEFRDMHAQFTLADPKIRKEVKSFLKDPERDKLLKKVKELEARLEVIPKVYSDLYGDGVLSEAELDKHIEARKMRQRQQAKKAIQPSLVV